MLVVWVAVRAVGPAEASRQPTVLLPTTATIPTTASPAPSVSWTPSPTPSRTSKSPKPTKKSPVPEKTTASSRPPSPTVTPRSGDDLSASLSVPASWEQGYVAAVRIRNNGRAAQPWTVTVSNSGLDDLRLTGTWNARGSQSGTKLTFTGDALAPGASVTFGYQVSKNGRGGARPSGCSVVGGKCSMS
jgi:cellulase/cellobiase CelA1